MNGSGNSDRRPLTIGPARRDETGLWHAELRWDDKLATAWTIEAVREAKRELVAMFVAHVFDRIDEDKAAFLDAAIKEITNAVRDEIAKAVADRLECARG